MAAHELGVVVDVVVDVVASRFISRHWQSVMTSLRHDRYLNCKIGQQIIQYEVTVNYEIIIK